MPDMASVNQGYNNSIPSLVLLLTSCLASRKPAKYHAVIICTASAGEASIIIDLSVQFFIFCFKNFLFSARVTGWSPSTPPLLHLLNTDNTTSPELLHKPTSILHRL